MGVNWTDDERQVVEIGIARHGIQSGRCAALARVVYRVAKPRDPHAHGVQLRPPEGAAWLVPKDHDRIPVWGSHVYVETQGHAVDAIAGPDGYPADAFVQDHWEWHDTLRVTDVDPETVDAGIQDMDEE